MASKVLLMRCSRAWTSTWMVTSPGICPPSMSSRQISYSVSEAEGKPISISFTPISTSVWKYSSFSSKFMGSIRAWLPSRRSTEHHTGALLMVLSGQVRPSMGWGVKGMYFSNPGFKFMGLSSSGFCGGYENAPDHDVRGEIMPSRCALLHCHASPAHNARLRASTPRYHP